MKMIRNRIEEIVKECYWDYDITADDIKNITTLDNMREKKKLFDKIIYNSSHKYLDLTTLFDKVTLRKLFDSFEITYNNDFISRQILLLRNLIFEEENIIKVLEWKKR
jgi:hypothetical protein